MGALYASVFFCCRSPYEKKSISFILPPLGEFLVHPASGTPIQTNEVKKKSVGDQIRVKRVGGVHLWKLFGKYV